MEASEQTWMVNSIISNFQTRGLNLSRSRSLDVAEFGTEPEISVLRVFAPLQICPSSLGHAESCVNELGSHSWNVPLGHPGGRDLHYAQRNWQCYEKNSSRKITKGNGINHQRQDRVLSGPQTSKRCDPENVVSPPLGLSFPINTWAYCSRITRGIF